MAAKASACTGQAGTGADDEQADRRERAAGRHDLLLAEPAQQLPHAQRIDHAADREGRDHQARDRRARLAGLCQQHRDIGKDAEQKQRLERDGRVADAGGADRKDGAVTRQHRTDVERLPWRWTADRAGRKCRAAAPRVLMTPRMTNMPRQWIDVGDDAGGRSAQQIAGDGGAEQPADHHLALRQRHEVGNQRHADREAAAAGRAGEDAQRRTAARSSSPPRTATTTPRAADRHAIIIRALPKASAIGPSTGCARP